MRWTSTRKIRIAGRNNKPTLVISQDLIRGLDRINQRSFVASERFPHSLLSELCVKLTGIRNNLTGDRVISVTGTNVLAKSVKAFLSFFFSFLLSLKFIHCFHFHCTVTVSLLWSRRELCRKLADFFFNCPAFQNSNACFFLLVMHFDSFWSEYWESIYFPLTKFLCSKTPASSFVLQRLVCQ